MHSGLYFGRERMAEIGRRKWVHARSRPLRDQLDNTVKSNNHSYSPIQRVADTLLPLFNTYTSILDYLTHTCRVGFNYGHKLLWRITNGLYSRIE